METNEQGLTKEEKIMFSILGLILIIAVGVLIINSFSSNERKLEDNQTPISENKDKTDNEKDEAVPNNSDSNLIEVTPEKSDTIVSNSKPIVSTNSSTSTKPTQVVSKPTPSTPIIKDDLDVDGEGSTQPSVTPTWNFKETVITEAYANDEIIIEHNVVLEDGTEVEAAVTLRKQEGNCYNIVDISSGKVIVTAGVYKYYYTYGDVTKELLLIVKNYLPHESIEFLNLTEEYVPESSITETDYNLLKETITNSELKPEEKIYTLTINKKSENPKTIPLVLTFANELTTANITTQTEGVTVKQINELWHQEIQNNQIILLLDTSLMDLTNNQINITINDIEYILYINIIENIVPEELPSETPDVTPDNEEEKENDDSIQTPTEDTEEENNEDGTKPTPEEDESSMNDSSELDEPNNNQEEITDNSQNSEDNTIVEENDNSNNLQSEENIEQTEVNNNIIEEETNNIVPQNSSN